MSRTSIAPKDFRCPCCGKLLATPEGIKCDRCKEVHSPEDYFPKGLWPDRLVVTYLWAPDGSHSSTIEIGKEIWVNIGKRQKGVPKGCLWYPVFFIYNYLDPAKAFAEDVGCRINEEPILDFQEALAIAEHQETDVRASGKWVEVQDIKRPEIKPPTDGIWSFRDLEDYTQKATVNFEDLSKTLASYSQGAAILSYVVIDILKKIELTKEEYENLEKIAHEGASRQRSSKEKDEWLAVARWLADQGLAPVWTIDEAVKALRNASAGSRITIFETLNDCHKTIREKMAKAGIKVTVDTYVSNPKVGQYGYSVTKTVSEELGRLIKLFAGKEVKITHTSKRVEDVEGVCKTIHAIPGTEGHYDLEFTNGSRYGFVPEVITEQSVDGKLHAFAGGCRKIEVV